jgi:hypothetical protein
VRGQQGCGACTPNSAPVQAWGSPGRCVALPASLLSPSSLCLPPTLFPAAAARVLPRMLSEDDGWEVGADLPHPNISDWGERWWPAC